MKVNIDYGRTEAQIKEASNQFLTRDYIEYAFGKAYPTGTKGQLLRQISQIQRKLDQAVDENLDEIDLDGSQMDLIRDAMDKTEFTTNITRFVVRLLDELKTS